MRFLAFLLLALLASPVSAANLTCTVPAAAISRAQELCEVVRVRNRVLAANWDNDVCATEILRIGLLQVERQVSTEEARATVINYVHDAIESYETNHPSALVSSSCGDNNVDSEFGEECDDGNTVGGDGCEADCTLP